MTICSEKAPCIITLRLWTYQTRTILGIWKLWRAYSRETPNLGQNRWCFVLCDLEIWQITLKINRASLLCCFKLCATFHSHWWIQTGVTVWKRPIWVEIPYFFVPCDIEIERMTLKNNRTSLLCYFKLSATYHSHWWIKTWVTVRKLPIWVKIGDYLSFVTLKFDRWPWKTIGHLSYATSSFVQHFIGIGEFNLELQSGNASLTANLMKLQSFDIWA